jgi:hypothetical protein
MECRGSLDSGMIALVDQPSSRWAEWNRRVAVLTVLEIAAWAALGLFVTLHRPVGEETPWDELAGLFVGVPIFAAIWPLRFSVAEWRGFLLPQVIFFLLTWLAIELI